MFNNDILKSALLAIPAGLPSIGGAIGSATTTVDLASSFLITQTVAMTATATLPNPSDPRAGDRVSVGSSTASTQNVLINGSILTPGRFAEFLWSGVAWLTSRPTSGATEIVFSQANAIEAVVSPPYAAKNSVTLTEIRSLVSVAPTSSLTITVLVNGTSVGSVTLGTGVTDATSVLSTAIISSDKVQVSASAGSGAQGLAAIVRFS